jgi:hypothetical protein
VKFFYFQQGFLNPLLFLYKLNAILDFGLWILDLRNSVHYNDRAKRFHQSEIPPGPLPARRLTGGRVGPYDPYGPEAAI